MEYKFKAHYSLVRQSQSENDRESHISVQNSDPRFNPTWQNYSDPFSYPMCGLRFACSYDSYIRYNPFLSMAFNECLCHLCWRKRISLGHMSIYKNHFKKRKTLSNVTTFLQQAIGRPGIFYLFLLQECSNLIIEIINQRCRAVWHLCHLSNICSNCHREIHSCPVIGTVIFQWYWPCGSILQWTMGNSMWW
jgi:hypothetical protein